MQTAATRKSRLLGSADKLLGRTATAFAAATGVGLVGSAQEAQAQIVYSGPVNIVIPDTADGLYFNVATGASTTAPPGPSGWDLNPYTVAAGSFNLWAATATTWFSPTGTVAGPFPLAPNTPIDATPPAIFTRPGGANNIAPQITLNAPNLFGFQFANELLGGINNFGWVEITFGGTAGTRSITGYAYESAANTTILAGDTGAVPEPSSLALLGLGAAGLAAYRRRRAAK